MYTITDVAMKYLEQHLKEDSVLVLSISGGCGGVDYQFGLSDSVPEGWVEKELVRVVKKVVDDTSHPTKLRLAIPPGLENLLDGTEIGFSEDINDPGFVFASPNLSTGSCGSCNPGKPSCC